MSFRLGFNLLLELLNYNNSVLTTLCRQLTTENRQLRTDNRQPTTDN
jgi:hypothetical protein